MERLIKHFEKNMDTPRELEDVAHKAFTAIDRGRFTKQAYKQLKNWEDAEDAVQDAYARLLHAIDKGIEIKKFDHYFTIVLRNAISDVFNKRRGMPDTVHPDTVEKLLEPEECEEVTGKSEEDLMTIRQVSKKLNPTYQAIIDLRFSYHHTNEEIVDILEVSPDKVKKAFYFLKKKLGEQNVGG